MKKLGKMLRALSENNVFLIALGLSSLATGMVLTQSSSTSSNNIVENTVMVVNAEKNSGGTGVVYSSSPGETTILTNSHVCGVVENGGLVVHGSSSYVVSTTKRSELYDLCLLTIPANLGVNSKVASRLPRSLETAYVSGHPALLPTVVSNGHFSGSDIVQVLTGFAPCDDEDNKSGDFFCALFGVKPVIKVYESQLVTATIMPGSSGSGVYNSDKELTGLVFAGAGNFGYGWTVPYESLVNFLHSEAPTLKAKKLGAFDISASKKKSAQSFQEALTKVRKFCKSEKSDKVQGICNLVRNDLVWSE